MKNTLDDALRLLSFLSDDLREATQMPLKLFKIDDPFLNGQLDNLSLLIASAWGDVNKIYYILRTVQDEEKHAEHALDDAFRLLSFLSDDLCDANQAPGRLRRIDDPVLNSKLDNLSLLMGGAWGDVNKICYILRILEEEDKHVEHE